MVEIAIARTAVKNDISVPHKVLPGPVNLSFHFRRLNGSTYRLPLGIQYEPFGVPQFQAVFFSHEMAAR